MSESFESALGIQAPSTATEASRPSKSVPFEDALGIQPASAAAAGSKGQDLQKLAGPVLEEGKQQLTGMWGQYNKNIDNALALMKQGGKDIAVTDTSTGQVPALTNIKGVGEGLLGLMQLIWSPAQTAVDQFVSKPSAAVVDKVGSLVPAAPDLPEGTRPPAFDPTIRRGDVKQTSEHLNDFMDTLYSTAAGFIGGGGALKARTGTGALEALTPEARAELKARPARAIAKLDSAFDELAAIAPEDARVVADKTSQVDANTAKYMKARIQKFIDASEKELNAVGEKGAKATIEDLEAKLPPNIAELAAKETSKAVEKGSKPRVKVPVDQVPFTQADDPKIVMMHMGLNPWDTIGKTKAGQIMEGKLREYYDFTIRNINPEALGTEAKKGAAIIARGIAELAHEDSKYIHRSEERRLDWEKVLKKAPDFIRRFEKGGTFHEPFLNRAASTYRQWAADILSQDRRSGIVDYDPLDHYMPHIFEDSKGVQEWLDRKFGPSWTRPGFTKERKFDLYDEAIEHGFKPKFSNPEDIMLARQHASDVARMKVEVLRNLEREGLAVKKVKGGEGPDYPSTSQPSPAGGSYWVQNDAYQVLHNAFNTQSLWTMKGPFGDAFRGMMELKNRVIPIKLGLSLFHPLHVQTIDNATAMTRAAKEMLAGTQNPAQFLYNFARAATYKGIWDNPKTGNRILKAFQGRLGDAQLTNSDKVAIRVMSEGGFIPELSSQYRAKALDNFRSSLARGSTTALWHAPWAALQLMQKPIFEVWIPSLKIASYLKDAATALRVNPSLASNEMERMLAFRKLAKSVDNRYGEMAYNTMFWNKWVKDIAVANTLSLGWQMGFIREYGGGMLDVGQALSREGTIASKAKSGMLDRPLFVTFYTAQSLAYGGLMTWAMTGMMPQSLMDYVYPKTGEKNKDGSDARTSTMFYAKEFVAVGKHIQTQGAASGLTQLAESKASGLIGLAKEGISGVNSWGDEIRDPDGKWYEKVGQTLAATMSELEPISLSAVKGDVGANWKTARSVAGFTPAPKYITQSKTDAAIDQVFRTYYAPKQTPYEKAQYSTDSRELRRLHDEDDMEGFDDKLVGMKEKYQLTNKEVTKLRTHIQKGVDPNLKKFEGFNWQQQKKLLDQMTPEEREKYIRHSNKQHLRYRYEPPEEESAE